MTVNEIKKELEARGWTQEDLANKLGMSHSNIRKVMCGSSRLTKQLEKHIGLMFEAERIAVLVYKVDLSDKQVMDLTSGKQFPDTEKGRACMMDALEAVVSHNIRRLADYGRTCNWTPEERRWLKLDEEDATPPPTPLAPIIRNKIAANPKDDIV